LFLTLIEIIVLRRLKHMTDSPVEMIVTDPLEINPEAGTALCLSGGGYRAMLFHVGALWRLYDARLLQDIQRISSVSGGSITAGVLALKWSEFSFDPDRLQSDFVPLLVSPIRALLTKPSMPTPYSGA
jgi:NTE family protein